MRQQTVKIWQAQATQIQLTTFYVHDDTYHRSKGMLRYTLSDLKYYFLSDYCEPE